MISQHLHLSHHAGIDILAHEGVFRAADVHILHIERAYRLAVELYRAVVRHLHPWHPRYDIGDTTVLHMCECRHLVCQRVAALAHALRPHLDSLQPRHALVHDDRAAVTEAGGGGLTRLIAKHRDAYEAYLLPCRAGDGECPVCLGPGESHGLLAAVRKHDAGRAQPCACLPRHHLAAVCLGVRPVDGEQGEQYD